MRLPAQEECDFTGWRWLPSCRSQASAQLLGVPQADRHRLFAWAQCHLDYDDRELGGQSEKVTAASAEMFAYGGEADRQEADAARVTTCSRRSCTEDQRTERRR